MDDAHPALVALRDGDLALVLRARLAPDADAGDRGALIFDLRRDAHPTAVGELTLRLGDGDAGLRWLGHLGYRVDPPHRGRHLAERACRLIAPLAASEGLDPLWLTCEPGNGASRRTAERLGATLIEIVDMPVSHPLFARGHRRKCRYRLPLAALAALAPSSAHS